VALAAAASPAEAFELLKTPSGEVKRWAAMPVSLAIGDAPAAGVRGGGERVAVRRAFAAWVAVADAGADVAFAGEDPGAEAQVLWAETWPDGLGDPALVAAATVLTAEDASGASSRAEVRLNAEKFSWATDLGNGAIDVEAAARHEAGHAFGLDHTAVAGALMVTQPPLFERLDPQADDRAGLAALYPVAEPRPAPAPSELVPACVRPGARASLRVRGAGERMEVGTEGAVAAEAATVREGEYSRATLDLRTAAAGEYDVTLVGNGKRGDLYGALRIGADCPAVGCACGGGSALAWIGLLAILPIRRGPRARARRKRRAASFCGAPLALAALICFAPLLSGFVRTTAGFSGPCVFWATRNIAYTYSADGTPDAPGDDEFTAVRKSFQTWEDVTCSDMTFRDLGPTARRDVGFDFARKDNLNLLLWRTLSCRDEVTATDPCWDDGSCGNVHDCWDHSDGVIALTTTTFNSATGQLVDADIEFNDAPQADGDHFAFTAVDAPECTVPGQLNCVRTDVQNTATHEIGHVLGFAHTPIADATMFDSAPLGETKKRSLAQDDIDALCTVYPSGARPSICIGDGTVELELISSSDRACGCRSAGDAAWPALIVLALRRRRAS
jgi:predicted Zn-dependent protease